MEGPLNESVDMRNVSQPHLMWLLANLFIRLDFFIIAEAIKVWIKK